MSSGHPGYQMLKSETSRRGYLELGDPVGWDETLEHVLEEKQNFIDFFRYEKYFSQKYFLDLKKKSLL